MSFSPDGGEHDWNYLLGKAGMLLQDRAVARLDRFAGVMVPHGVAGARRVVAAPDGAPGFAVRGPKLTAGEVRQVKMISPPAASS